MLKNTLTGLYLSFKTKQQQKKKKKILIYLIVLCFRDVLVGFTGNCPAQSCHLDTLSILCSTIKTKFGSPKVKQTNPKTTC